MAMVIWLSKMDVQAETGQKGPVLFGVTYNSCILFFFFFTLEALVTLHYDVDVIRSITIS